MRRAEPRPLAQLPPPEVAVPTPANICDPATTVVDFARHKFVRIGNELVLVGRDALGEQRASALLPFGKPLL